MMQQLLLVLAVRSREGQVHQHLADRLVWLSLNFLNICLVVYLDPEHSVTREQLFVRHA